MQYTLSQNLFFKKLEKAQNILIAGAGGGFDIYSGLPLYFNLRAQGKRVHLANFSFTHLSQTTASRCRPVDAVGNLRVRDCGATVGVGKAVGMDGL